MARTSRENTIVEKQKMPNERNRRKRQIRAAKKKEARETIEQKGKVAFHRARELAHGHLAVLQIYFISCSALQDSIRLLVRVAVYHA